MLGRHVIDTAKEGLLIPRGVVHVLSSTVLGFGDSSFAKGENVKSQYGMVIGLTHEPEKVINGIYTLMVLIIYLSGVVRRVVRSTLAAEGYAISETQETSEWLRMVVVDMLGPRVATLRDVRKAADEWPMITISDSPNLADTVQSDAGITQDKRFRVVVAMLREGF